METFILSPPFPRYCSTGARGRQESGVNRVERLLSPEMVAEIMSVSKRKAYDIMNSIPHIPRPLRVKERDLREYIDGKMIYPMPVTKRKRRAT